MKKVRKGVIGACIGMALCTAVFNAGAAEPALYVYSTIDALLAGAYDGKRTVKELRVKGDFGLGTFNHLDGEMVVLGGNYYHVRADGSVSLADASEQVPLAYVLHFKPSSQFTVGQATAGSELSDMEALIDARLPNKNQFYALQVSGVFSNVSTRAIAAQARPYRPLAEVLKTQSVFKREVVAGTMIGIRSPGFTKGVSVPGWHWHFISGDKAYGGHVLTGWVVQGVVSVQGLRRFEVDIPDTDDFASADQTKDRGEELHQVEKLRR